MKYLKLYEAFVNDFMINEKDSKYNEKVALLMDGTGSAGKSYTLKSIGGKKPKEGEDAGDDYEVIALDDFFPHDVNVSMSDPNDLANQKRWKLEKAAGVPDEVIEWGKKMEKWRLAQVMLKRCIKILIKEEMLLLKN